MGPGKEANHVFGHSPNRSFNFGSRVAFRFGGPKFIPTEVQLKQQQHTYGVRVGRSRGSVRRTQQQQPRRWTLEVKLHEVQRRM